MKAKAKFVRSSSFTRGAEHTRCSLCNHGYDKWTYQYAKVTEGELSGAVICPDCLKERNFDERRDKAVKQFLRISEDYVNYAETLKQIDSWDVPTYEEWKRNEDMADKEYMKEMQS